MKYPKLLAYSLIIVVIAIFYSVKYLSVSDEVFAEISPDSFVLSVSDYDDIPYYYNVHQRQIESGIPFYTGDDIVIDSIMFLDHSDDANIRVENDANINEDVLIWENGMGWVEWEVEVPEEGMYYIEVEYQSIQENSSSSIFYNLQINGQYPFSEAKSLEFVKYWKDVTVPYDRDLIGNEIRSPQMEIKGWNSSYLTDYGISSTPLLFHLNKGNNKLRFIAINEGMVWGDLTLKAPRSLPDYEEYITLSPDSPPVSSWHTIMEAERYTQKSHPSIQTGSHNEPHVSPDPLGRIVYNTIDGNRWKKPGEFIDWTFEVPETGWYEIDLKYFQRFNGKSNIYRTIEINGQVPFLEMLNYAIPYNNQLEFHTLQNADGESYKFLLQEGENTLRMISDASMMNSALLALRQTTRALYQLEQEIRKITGDYGVNAIDRNRTWDLQLYIPDIDERLAENKDLIELVKDTINGFNQNTTDVTNSLNLGITILDDLLEDIEDIPNKIVKFSELQTQIGSWLDTFSDQGLTLDLIVVRTPDTELNLPVASTLNKIPYTAVNFIRTFFLQYDTRDFNEDALVVWVGRGRDYANLLQEKINQDFTPLTGIAVNVNLMPDPNALTLSNAAGDQPDVALALEQNMAVDYAMREAAVDLTQYENFDEVVARFHPGAMRSFYYNQGVYGLPETQSYYLMFYRNSIFRDLGIEAPDTWDDMHTILPTLQENGMSFFYPARDFVPFFYQHGTGLYSEDGLSPAFDNEESYQAFTLWTELFSRYGIPKDVPAFFNHFKMGDIPIGVSDFNTYIQLLVAAPEVRGDWGILPLPGIMQDDGEVARWAPNNMTAAIILNKSDKKQEAWQFLDWWTSTETQLHYGIDIESFFGLEYRWNTANMEALVRMPWPSEDIEAIKEQNRWTKNVPFVPGGYFLGREMEFAWNRAVLENVPPKDALDKAFISLSRELIRKQEDLRIDDDYNLSVPVIDKPYEWGSVQ